MTRHFVHDIDPPEWWEFGSQPARWFIVRGGELLVRGVSVEGAEVPEGLFPGLPDDALGQPHYLGQLAGEHCFAVSVQAGVASPEGAAWQGLRSLFGVLDDHHYAIAGRAAQIVQWERTHRFCGACGDPTERSPGERAMRCTACGLLSYPRISPAVIVRVERGDQILLARNVKATGEMHGLIAGFVDAGESLEEAVAREIAEEVDLAVTDIAYAGSQPWPFPSQLMLGFSARHASGEIMVNPNEIASADWFSRDSLPEIPPKLSIARQLIDEWIERV